MQGWPGCLARDSSWKEFYSKPPRGSEHWKWWSAGLTTVMEKRHGEEKITIETVMVLLTKLVTPPLWRKTCQSFVQSKTHAGKPEPRKSQTQEFGKNKVLSLQGGWKYYIIPIPDSIKTYCYYYYYYCEWELQLFLSGGVEFHTVDFNFIKLKRETRIGT